VLVLDLLDHLGLLGSALDELGIQHGDGIVADSPTDP
jgi:hypothetical protein